ncbi:integrase [Gossypium australe]|uniref:Integrase n=1 Tax=Gossypium australe TaxID=47621 RepID=A0A5B6WSB9_9ROSI|nr:integrase [Gossypium australe]
MKREILEFLAKCFVCQQIKTKYQERVTMDFVSGLPLTPKKKDVMWVIVDRLKKSAHFILVRTDYSLE